MGYRSVCHFAISDEMYTFMRICNPEIGFRVFVLGLGVQFRTLRDLADENRSACEDLLHASTPPQVETARAYELAKCRDNERWPPSPPDRRDRSRSPRGRSTIRRPATAPLRYSLRQEWNLSLKKAKRILDTRTIRRAPALQSRAEPAL